MTAAHPDIGPPDERKSPAPPQHRASRNTADSPQDTASPAPGLVPESYAVARHLAACPYYLLPAPDRGDGKARFASTAAATADGDTVTVTVTDFDGATRVYVATVRHVGPKCAVKVAAG
jgi:hypothetical protein